MKSRRRDRGEKLLAVYRALWTEVQAHKVTVRCTTALHPGEAGRFHPDMNGCGPVIEIYNPNYGATNLQASELGDVPMLERLIVLAHEYGHCLSWRAGHRTAEYEAAAVRFGEQALLDRWERRLIRAEEARAWRRGRRVLRRLGFRKWKAFSLHCTSSRRIYERKLGS